MTTHYETVDLLADLLAIIHRDGGHFVTEQGLTFATQKAMELVAEQRRMIEDLHAVLDYPQHWDTAAYPTLASALKEVTNDFKCSDEAHQMTREQAIVLACKHAAITKPSYYREPFHPHSWVIAAIMEAANNPPQGEVPCSDSSNSTTPQKP